MEITNQDEAEVIASFSALQQKVNHLLSLDVIYEKDLEGMTSLERKHLSETFTNRLEQANGVERDKFVSKISPVLSETSNGNIWEYNHELISRAISKYMIQHGVIPGKSALAQETGLTRLTIAKHLKEYKHNPAITEEMEHFRLMVPNLLANVYKTAVKGYTRAARLYLQMVGACNKPVGSTVVNTQTNYIQIKNTILSQENLNRLTAQQLDQIESIIASCVAPVQQISG